MSVPEAGAALLALFAVFYYLRIFPTITAIFGLVSVVCLGLSGWIGRVLTDIAGWIVHLTNTVTADAIGETFAGVLALVLIVIFLHDMHPRHQTRQRTAWVGVALGVLIVAGLTGIPALGGLRSDITGTVSSALSLL